jgi:ATP-binding cassette subfamily B protein
MRAARDGDAGIADFVWPLPRLGEALWLLSRHSGLRPAESGLPRLTAPPDPRSAAYFAHWLEETATAIGVEVEPVHAVRGEVGPFLHGAAPALLRAPSGEGGEDGYLLLLTAHGGSVRLLHPADLQPRRVAARRLAEALCRPTPAEEAEVQALLSATSLSSAQRLRARAALLKERARGMPLSGGYLLRPTPETAFVGGLRRGGALSRLALLVFAHAIEYGLALAAFWLIGRGAFDGRSDRGWLSAFVLLLLSQVPLRMATSWLVGSLAVDLGGLLKQRLLLGALRLRPEELRHQGAGQFLSRVLESEALEALATGGGLQMLLAGVELLLASFVLSRGATALLHVLLLWSWVALLGVLGAYYHRRRQQWTESRLNMTHGLVERMVGHRTRLAQQPRAHWHDGEDGELAQYLDGSAAMDRLVPLYQALPRGFLLLSLSALLPALVTNFSPARCAVSLGGVLLGQRALLGVAQGLSSLYSALIAWREVEPLYRAAARTPRSSLPGTAALSPAGTSASAGEGARTAPLLRAADLRFRFPERAEPVLRNINLTIWPGDRILLEGGSGGGKSTLAALLTGLRAPDSGLLLLAGVDHKTLGEARWRKLVAAAPQFHENR